MRILWKLIKNLIRIFLLIIIIYYSLYFIVVYNDVILSIGAKKELRGKIVYSAQGHHINIIELPLGKKKSIYSVPKESDRYLASVLSPYFSPDGKMIIFSKRDDPRVDFRYKLWIMNSNGTDIKKFIDFDDRYLLSPSWSPDGKKIAFVVRNSQRGGEGGIYIINTENPSSISCVSDILPSPIQPTWSPDSRKLAFTSEELFRKTLGENLYAEVDRGGIYIVDILDKSCKKFINLASQPAWSPDSKKIAYGTKNGYYIMSIKDEYNYNNYLIIPYKKPFFGMGGSFPVRWSPDGNYIAFCKEIWPGLAGIYVVSIDNPKRHIRIATDNEAIIGMSWVK